MSDSNGLIASDDGRENPSISTAGKYAVIEAILCLVIFFAFAFYCQHQRDLVSPKDVNMYGMKVGSIGNAELAKQLNIAYYSMIVLGISCVIWALWVRAFISNKIKVTEVRVYQDKVKGTAVSKDFSMSKLIFFAMGWNHAKLNSFDLTFNQITSVDNLPDDYSIIINASGAQYKCFVSNGSKIQEAINNKIRN